MSDRQARWRTTGFLIALVAIAVAFFALGHGLSATEDATVANKRANDTTKRGLFVACTLLANAIVESGADQASSGQATQLFLTAIKRVMTPGERAQLDAALAHTPQGGLTVPPCKAIAEHPETVQAAPTPATPTPTPAHGQ